MKDIYESPLNSRYSSKEMKYIFSPDFKFKTWRKLWIALAESEMELGLNITQEQIDELKAHAEDINYEVAEAYEKEFCNVPLDELDGAMRVLHPIIEGVKNKKYLYGILLKDYQKSAW